MDEKKVIKYVHHNAEVSVMEHLKGTHRDHCLCFQGCKYFKPNTDANCSLAQELYQFDVTHGMTTPVFECPKFER